MFYILCIILISLKTFWGFNYDFSSYRLQEQFERSWLDTHSSLYEGVHTNKQTNLLYFLKISVLFCILTMVLAHVVWIIPLQRSQSRWGRRRVGWQARRKIWGHWGFVPSYFWKNVKLEEALCVEYGPTFMKGGQ